jgi:hypothetical protein
MNVGLDHANQIYVRHLAKLHRLLVHLMIYAIALSVQNVHQGIAY